MGLVAFFTRFVSCAGLWAQLFLVMECISDVMDTEFLEAHAQLSRSNTNVTGGDLEEGSLICKVSFEL